MITIEQIRAYADRIVKEFDPERIILFGSFASGIPTVDSDVDLMVVMPFSGNSVTKSADILRRTAPTFAIDLLVRSPESIDRRLEMGDSFIREIIATGKPLYEKANGRVG
ncbi:MAG TPA: nucleotidyltransferase domain-containing protein [Candidatus Kapabacteria bacterium]|nr:nucleotidyltransferase domain-containing protein [Candidatus Kapabacteria bacterium]